MKPIVHTFLRFFGYCGLGSAFAVVTLNDSRTLKHKIVTALIWTTVLATLFTLMEF